ncbi:MAG: LysM peptidoglycan-binding domain-containing protein [Gammaproteobacteria bacterium]|nr:LysM peptidoglycan-binding domain-containing protein [Gammaproteobacteria bacterium]MDH5728128.1 LysM peptidoglycan-binding domain-containing protein [Gammaproteobacteria bacterium]
MRPTCFLWIILSFSLFGCATQQAIVFTDRPNFIEDSSEDLVELAPYHEWTSDLQSAQETWLPLTTNSAHIVGRLPGQTNLPLDHYFEVAVHDFPVEEGTLLYSNDEPPKDLLQRLRLGFELPHQRNKRTNNNIRWYERHPSYVKRVLERSEPYLHYILEEVEKRGMPTEIALLPIVESAFKPFAYSHGRAAGIWQFIPSTGRLYGLKQNWWYDGRRDIVASTDAALTFLQRLARSFDGDWLLALAAYNSGQGTVSRAIRKNKRKGLATDFWSLDLPKETRGYVPKLIAIATIVDHPQNHGVALPELPNEPYLASVDTGSQIDLALAAELADISLDELYLLNPGFNRWATDPKGPHQLLVPVANVEIFRENLANLPDEQRIRWKRHKIRKGESLLAIADKFNTTVASIKEVNKIRGNQIRAGKSLIIPVATKDLDSYTFSADKRLERLQNTRRSGKQKITVSVRKGDTLWDIARKYGVGVRRLAKWNGLAPRDTLRAGQKLVIWSKRSNVTRAKQAEFSPHSRETITQKINYRVRRGDSLARISDKFNVNVSDLLRWNHRLKNKKYLQPGQNLTLYVDVTRQAGT